MIRGTLLIIWGWIVLWSVISGRPDLLLRDVFHSLVGVSGAALILAGVVLVMRHRGRRERMPWTWWSSATIALLVLIMPPNPSFSDLAENRPQGLPEPPELAFVLPPGQRTLLSLIHISEPTRPY